jgi:hypothetical protein
MAKVKISEFSSTAGNNTDIDGINLAEGMAPSLVNDAIRELMAQLKDFQTGAVGDSFNGPIGTSTAAAGAFTTLSASSTLAVTGVATLTAQPILSSLTASRAVFTDASKGLVSNAITGTGNVVMSTSPTLVTPVLGAATGTSFQGIIGNVTPAAGNFTTLGASSTATLNTLASSGATLTGGTINGMTVGATTASSGAFTTVTASTAIGTTSGGTGLSSFTSGGVVYASSTSALATGSALTWNGTVLNAVGKVQSTNSTNTVGQTANFVLNTFNTNFGATDSATLQSVLNNTTTGANDFFIKQFNHNQGTTSDIVLKASSGDSGFVSLYAANTEGLRLTSTGLGIGTSSPDTKLNVEGGTTRVSGTRTSGSFLDIIPSNTGSDGVFLASSYHAAGSYGPIKFATSGSEKMRLDTSGNLGLGVTPSAWSTSWKALQIGSVAALYSQNSNTYLSNNEYFNSSGDPTYLTSSFATRYLLHSTGEHRWYNASSGTAGNTISATQAMTLDASGSLSVGTTSARGVKATFESDTIGSANIGIVQIRSTKAADSGDCLLAIVKQANDDTTSQVFVRFGINGYSQGCGQINGNGASSAAFGSFSDYRLKENIESLPSQLSNIMALRPVEFDYIESEGGGHQIGFIAQEMQGVYPDVVGQRDSDEMLTVTGWSKTEARLVKAIQEQQAMIESLRQRLSAANL